MVRDARHPTELELEILKILWERGPMRVREVREALAPTRGLAYTSVMTMMGIMTKKRFLRRKKDGNTYVYRAVAQKEPTTRSMMRDLVDRLFEGSTSSAVLQLLQAADLDDVEREKIRRLIEQKEDQP
jgi:predicted transcriptional regulator